MSDLAFGRFESVPILNGELVLDPWPTCVREIKFGSESPRFAAGTQDFCLKHQIVEFLKEIRSVECGTLRCLVFRHGLPFTMEMEAARPEGVEG
jgi:hypothetical protein